MEKLPVTSQQFPVETEKESKLQPLQQLPFGLPFFSFSYTSLQMHSADGQTHVESKQVSFDGNKLNVEQFEGQLAATVFEQTMLDTQRLLIDHTATMFKQMSSWLPFSLLVPPDDRK